MNAVVAPAVKSEQVRADIEAETVTPTTGKDMVRIAASGSLPAAPFAALCGAKFVKQRFVDDLHARAPWITLSHQPHYRRTAMSSQLEDIESPVQRIPVGITLADGVPFGMNGC